MKVTITFFGQIKAAVGEAERIVDVTSDMKVHTLIGQLAAECGDAASRILLGADGAPHPSLLVVLNDAQLLSGENAVLKDDDRLTLMPPISGGCLS